jgi:ABC-type glutathione transport system ATPase component
MENSSIMRISGLSKSFAVKKSLFAKRHVIEAVKDVSFELFPEEALGIIGESGCGKTTAANLILKLTDPDSGKIELFDTDVTRLDERNMRRFRKDIQIIFQYTNAVLDPKMTIDELLKEPLTIHRVVPGNELDNEVKRLLAMVGIPASERGKFPSQLSGGQNQRIIIARAIATRPKIIICDEPVSALDVSIQCQILNLLKRLQKELRLTYLFISHDIKVIEFICGRIAVMYRGGIVETGNTLEVLNNPRHEYTKKLISAKLTNK